MGSLFRVLADSSPAVATETQGLRSLRDLTQHLTARTDDSHAAPVQHPRRNPAFTGRAVACQALVRFFALHRIKPHAPPLVRAPVNFFEF